MHLVLFLSLKPSAQSASGGFLLLALDHDPALQLRNRLAFLDPHHIARRVLIALVVRVVVLRTADRLLVDRVREAAIDAHDHGLVLLVADDDALKSSLRHLNSLTLLALGLALLPGDGLDAGDVAPRLAHARGILELTRGPLEAQV